MNTQYSYKAKPLPGICVVQRHQGLTRFGSAPFRYPFSYIVRRY